MSYNPGIQDLRGQLRAQGKVALAGGIAQGAQQGFEAYNVNKQKNAAISGANEAMLKPFLSDPEFQKYAPEGIDKFLTKREKEGGLSLKDNIQLSGMLTAAAATRKMSTEQQIAQQEMAGRAQEQQMNAMKIAAAQRQQAAEAQTINKARQYEQFLSGVGTGVLKPGVQTQMTEDLKDPMVQAQLSAIRSTGAPMGPEALGQFTNQRTAVNAKAEGPRPFKTVEVRKTDPKTGNAIIETYDADTRELLGSGPVSQSKHVLTPEEKAKEVELTKFAEKDVETVNGYLAAGDAAGGAIADIDRGLSLLNEVETGFGAAAVQKLKQAGRFMGVDTKGVEKAEELQNILGGQVMTYVNQTKGAVSDKEMKLFEGYAASMGKTPEGNRLILTAARRHATRARDIAIMVSEARDDGKNANEIRTLVRKYQNENPLFDELKKGSEKGSEKTAAPATAPTAPTAATALPKLPAKWKMVPSYPWKSSAPRAVSTNGTSQLRPLRRTSRSCKPTTSR